MKKVYRAPLAVQVNLLMEEGVLLTSLGVNDSETRPGSGAWSEEKHGWNSEDWSE